MYRMGLMAMLVQGTEYDYHRWVAGWVLLVVVAGGDGWGQMGGFFVIWVLSCLAGISKLDCASPDRPAALHTCLLDCSFAGA
jgi:hypothetical protein